MERTAKRYETKYEKGKPFWSEFDHKRMIPTTILFYVDGELKDSYVELRECSYKLTWSNRLQADVKEYLE